MLCHQNFPIQHLNHNPNRPSLIPISKFPPKTSGHQTEIMLPNLPPEIITDILCRLPPKSLMRFRCVSKPWCYLIDCPDFIKMHLRQSQKTCSNLSLILGFMGIHAVGMDTLDSARALNPPFSSSDVSNSCNGLVLVLGQNKTPYIWNPFTRKYKTLPENPVEYPVEADVSSCYKRFGFGYDSLNDDYKVLRAVEFRGFDSDWISTEAKVYSLKSNSWSKVEDFPYPIPRTRGWGVHVNGALHTVVPSFDNSELSIVGFDLRTQKSCVVPKPAFLVKSFYMSVHALGGCLCLLSPAKKKHGTDIWIMKEYGIKESWAKLLSIAPPMIEQHTVVFPIAYSKRGDEVLLNLNDERLVWYDLGRKTIRNVSVRGLPFRFYAEVCVESLIPVESCDGGNEIKKVVRQEKRNVKTRRKRSDFLSEGFKLVL